MDTADRLGNWLAGFMVAVCMGVKAWAFSLLWNWFIVPLGFPVIDWPLALGICLLIGFFSVIRNFRYYYKLAQEQKQEEEEAEEDDRPIWTKKFTERVTLVVFCVMMAGAGWAWHYFMM